MLWNNNDWRRYVVKRIYKAFTGAVGAVMFFGCLLADSSAVSARNLDTVDIQLPGFPINLNHYYPIPEKESYPPIIYKGVTYIPMTWNNCMRLNLTIAWNEDTGLSISKKTSGMPTYPYEAPAEHDNDKNAVYEASIAAYPITVNGKTIDNSQEPYPILSFRDITYFPLTWRYAHDEFHWMTDWSDTDGFTLLSGDEKYVISSIFADMDNFLYISTRVYGILRLDKSLQGNVEAAAAFSSEQAWSHRNVGYVKNDPEAKSNQTRLVNGRIMLGDIELELLDQTADINLEDTVVSAGASRVVSVSKNNRNDGSVYLVTGNRAELLDRQPLYRKFANPNGSFWVTTAVGYSDVHHISWVENKLWLISKDGGSFSLNNQLAMNFIRILSVLGDGTLIVSARDSADDQSPADIYRIGPDGKAVKMYESMKGNIYADESGEVYVCNYAENRISKLSSGKSVVLSDITLFQAAKGRPQPLDSH
jgi:hypothetical protein